MLALLIDDELHRTGSLEASGSRPLRPEEVAPVEIEDPTEWFARDADVLESLDGLARYANRRR